MAITRDTGIHLAGQTNTTVTFTSAMTIADNPNRILLFVADGDLSVDRVTGVTWAGQAMTKILSVQKPSNRWNSYWYLLAPTVGTQNLVVTNSASAYTEPSLVCYYNAQQVAPEASASNSGISASGGYGTSIQAVDGQTSYNIVLVDRTDNPQGAAGPYIISALGDTQKATVTSLTSGAFIAGFLGSGGGSWTAAAISLLPIPDPVVPGTVSYAFFL